MSDNLKLALFEIYQEGYADGLKAVPKHLTLKDAPLETPIEELDFSHRTYNVLRREGVCTIADLIKWPEVWLLNIRNFPLKCALEVKQTLGSLGYSLAPKYPDFRREEEEEEEE